MRWERAWCPVSDAGDGFVVEGEAEANIIGIAEVNHAVPKEDGFAQRGGHFCDVPPRGQGMI